MKKPPAEDQITLVVQINGKVRDRIQVPADVSEEETQELPWQAMRCRSTWEESRRSR